LLLDKQHAVGIGGGCVYNQCEQLCQRACGFKVA